VVRRFGNRSCCTDDVFIGFPSLFLPGRVCKLATENCEGVYRTEEGVTLVERDAVAGIHMAFQVQGFEGLDFQAFFDLLQRWAEDDGFIPLEEESYDDLLPLDVVRKFADSFACGLLRMFQ